MEANMNLQAIITNGVQTGLKNFLSILGAVVLWMLTIWIPYLNVGTTIAIVTLPISMSRGNIISPLEIFDSKYRKNFGEFFLTAGLLQLGTFIASMFMVIPGIVLSIAWSQSLFLVVDKNLNPTEALKKSNEMTYNYRWQIFGSFFLVYLAAIIAIVIFSLIPYLGMVLNLAVMLAIMPIFLGIASYIYKNLSELHPIHNTNVMA